jgi:chromosome segregation ATPase
MAAPTQLDRIEAKLATIETEQQEQTGLLDSLRAKGTLTMSAVSDLAAQLDAATTAEADALSIVSAKIDAENTKIDGVQAELQSLFDRLQEQGVSRPVLDSIQSSITKLGGSTTALADAGASLDVQAARLTGMAVDPSNPVPTPPPAG